MAEPYPVARIEAIAKTRNLSLRGLSAAAGFEATYLASAKRQYGGEINAEAAAKFAAVLKLPLAELAAEAPLAAAIPPAPAASPSQPAPAELDTVRIPLSLLLRSDLNPRRTFDEEALVLLAQSIAEQGLLQNLVVRPNATMPNGYLVVAGERRYRALVSLERQGILPPALAAGIPCRVVQASDAEHVALAILENLQRQDVNPMEEAQGFKTLMTLDPARWSTAAIAQQIGMTRRHVQLRLQLCERLAPEVQAALAAGTLPLAFARELTTASAAEQKKALKELGQFRTADELRRKLRGGWIPVGHAIFPLDGVDPAHIVEDPASGERFFRDRKKFLALQIPAVDRLEAELKTRFAWVERRRYGWNILEEYPKAKDPAKAGAVLVFEQHDGAVTVYEGRGPSKYAKLPPEEARRQERENGVRQQMARELAEEREAFVAALGAKLTGLDALRLILFTAIGPAGWSERALDTHRKPPVELFKTGKLATLTKALDRPEEGRARVAGGKEAQAWKAVAELGMPEVLAALECIVAGQLHVVDRQLHPAIADLRKATKTPLPPLLAMSDVVFAAEIRRRAALPAAEAGIEEAAE